MVGPVAFDMHLPGLGIDMVLLKLLVLVVVGTHNIVLLGAAEVMLGARVVAVRFVGPSCFAPADTTTTVVVVAPFLSLEHRLTLDVAVVRYVVVRVYPQRGATPGVIWEGQFVQFLLRADVAVPAVSPLAGVRVAAGVWIRLPPLNISGR